MSIHTQIHERSPGAARIVTVIAVVLGIGLAGLATSVSATPLVSIQQTLESAKIGQWVAVEGVVVESLGESRFRIRDDSGQMPVVIPEHITREQGVPQMHERIRVSGKIDTKKLDHDMRGMRVQFLERMGVDTGGRGAPAPDVAPVEIPNVVTPPAAPAGEQALSQPMLGDELVSEMRALRRQYAAAKKDAEDLAAIYARAEYVAGPNGTTDPDLLRQVEEAEARVREIQARAPALIRAAKDNGLEAGAILMYEQAVGLR